MTDRLTDSDRHSGDYVTLVLDPVLILVILVFILVIVLIVVATVAVVLLVSIITVVAATATIIAVFIVIVFVTNAPVGDRRRPTFFVGTGWIWIRQLALTAAPARSRSSG